MRAVTSCFGGNEVGDFAALAPYRGDAHLFGVKASVLSLVDDLPLPGFSLENGRPKLLVNRRVLFARFQDPGVLSECFLAAVPGDASEGGVDILDVTGGIGNHDGFRGLLDGSDQAEMLSFARLRPEISRAKAKLYSFPPNST